MSYKELMDKYLDEDCFVDFIDPSKFEVLKNISTESGKVITIISTAINGSEKQSEGFYETELAQLSMIHIFNDDVYGSIHNLATTSPIRDYMMDRLNIAPEDVKNAKPFSEELSKIINIAFKEHIIIGFNFYREDYARIKESKEKHGLRSVSPAQFFELDTMINTMEGKKTYSDLDMKLRSSGVDYDDPIFNDNSTISNAVKLVSLANDFFGKHDPEKIMELYGTPEEKKANISLLHSSRYSASNDQYGTVSHVEKAIMEQIGEMTFSKFKREAPIVVSEGLPTVMYVLNEMLDTGRISPSDINLDPGDLRRVANAFAYELERERFDYKGAISSPVFSEGHLSDITPPSIYLKAVMSELGFSWPEQREMSITEVENSPVRESAYEIEFGDM